MFPESPRIAALRALEAAQSRRLIRGISIHFNVASSPLLGGARKDKTPRNEVDLEMGGLWRRRSERLTRALDGWAADFSSFFTRCRITLLSLDFNTAVHLGSPPVSGEGLATQAAAATRRLEILALEAALADSETSLAEGSLSAFLDTEMFDDERDPFFSFMAATTSGLRGRNLAPLLQQWWRSVGAWRLGVSHLQINANFGIRSMHEVAAIRAEAAAIHAETLQ